MMNFLQNINILDYKIVAIIFIVFKFTHSYLIKRQQLKNEYLIRSQELSNEQLAIQISNRNEDIKRLRLKNSKIYIDKYNKFNSKNLKSDLKTKDPKLTVKYRKSSES